MKRTMIGMGALTSLACIVAVARLAVGYSNGAQNPPSEQPHSVSPASVAPLHSILMNKILFIASSKPEWGYDIFAISPDGSGRTNLTRSPESEFDPVLSPDGTRIAFAALSDASERRTDIFVMNADGTGRRQVTHNDPGILAGAPTWSPDAKQIAFFTTPFFLSGGEWTPSQLYAIGADGRNVRRLGNGEAPVWSPDGRRMLYFDAKGRLSVMDADGGNPKQISDPEGRFGRSAAWSLDGQRIVYIGQEGSHDQVFIMDADGSRRTRLTGTADQKSGLQWTPDGKQIVFSRVTASDFFWPEKSAVYVMTADGKNEGKLDEGGLTGGGSYGAFWVRSLIGSKLEAAKEKAP